MGKFHYQDAPKESDVKAFSKYLSEDEELVLVTGLSGAYMRQEFIIYLLLPGVIFALGAVALGWFLSLSKMWTAILALTLMFISGFIKTLHLYHSHRYLLTTRRAMIKQGLLSVKLTTALYDKITHIEVDQSLVDRLLLHHGTVIVNTAGMNKNEFILKYIDYPIEFKNLLERLINKEREQMGRKFEPLSAVEGEVIS